MKNFKNLFQLIQNLFKYGKRRIFISIIGISLVSLEGLVMVVYVHWFRHIIDLLNWPPESQTITHLFFHGVGIFSILALGAAFRYTGDILLVISGEMLLKKLRVNLFEKFQLLSLDFFQKHSLGSLLSRFSTDIQSLQKVLPSICYILRGVLYFTGMVVTAFYFDWLLTLYILPLIFIIFIPMWYLGEKGRSKAIAFRENVASLQTNILEFIFGMRIVRIFLGEELAIAKFRKISEDVTRTAIEKERIRQRTFLAMSLGISLLTGIVIFRLGYGILAMGKTPGTMVAYLFAVTTLQVPLFHIAGGWTELQKMSGSSEKIFQFLEQQPSVPDEGTMELNEPITSLEFSNVSFAYDDKPVLKNISFQVNRGEKLAFVGENGAGKTTLLNLIPRFYDVNRGVIYINNANIEKYNLKSLRSKITVVSQEFFLFNDTIWNNIAYGKPDATDAEILEVARKANVDKFVSTLPDGYQAMVGENGSALSVGQRQRITIARAFLKNSPILLLDEPLGSQDVEAEVEVTRSLIELTTNRLTLIVTHRPSLLKHIGRFFSLPIGVVKENFRERAKETNIP